MFLKIKFLTATIFYFTTLSSSAPISDNAVDVLSSSQSAGGSTGYEDLDYWELEMELAKEMISLEKQKAQLSSPQEMEDEEYDEEDDDTDLNPILAKRNLLKRQTSVEARLIAAKYKNKNKKFQGQNGQPRWMRLVYEMKHRRRTGGPFKRVARAIGGEKDTGEDKE